MITSNGLIAINQHLTNTISTWAGSIALGAMSSSATASTSTALQYEFLRVPVVFKSYRTVNGINQIAIKGTLDPTSIFNAYEIGLFPMTVNPTTYIDNFAVTDFSEFYSGSSAWYISGSPATSASVSPTPRIGSYSIQLSSGSTAIFPGTASVSPFYLTTNRYTSNDSLHILYYVSNTISSTASLTVYFGDDAATGANIWSASTTISAGTASGSFYSSSLVFNAKPDNFTDNVISASISLAGSGTIYLDHMKFMTATTKTTEELLVSRTASATPLITKVYGQPMDIEYYIQVT